MRALIIVHDPGSVAKVVGERLVDHGFEIVELPIAASVDEPESDTVFPDPADFDIVVPMGAIWSVYDDATIGSWIQRELDFLRACDAAATPVLGICFGSQAIASALGGSTMPTETPQVGWFEIDSTVPEQIAPGPWMEWHYDRSEPPPGAEVLASDASCVQAFRLRRNLGVQFHPEVDRAHVAFWLEQGGSELLGTAGIDADALLADTERHAAQARSNAFRLVDYFLTAVAGFDLETPADTHIERHTT